MKIIISPAKTQSKVKTVDVTFTKPKFWNKYKKLHTILKSMEKEELSEALSIKGKILDEVYDYYQNESENLAISLYDGQVFKQLYIDHNDRDTNNYLEDHIVILSAMYGVLRPYDRVQNYRLDMNSKIGVDLQKYWSDDVTKFFKKELVINLASNEFSKLYKGNNMYTINFVEKGGKSSSTYSKIARGKFLNLLVRNKANSLEDVINTQMEDYKLIKVDDELKIITFQRTY